MGTRILSAIVGIILLLAVMFSKSIVFTVAVSLIASLAIYEALRAYKYNKNKLFIISGVLVSFLFAWAGYIKYEILFFAIFLIFAMFVGILLKKHKEILTKDILTIFSLIILIPFAYSTLGYLRAGENGMFLVWLPFISAWLTDTFAYFGGYFFGKNKLCPEISPKKTKEGAVSGVVGAVIGYIVYALMLKNIWAFNVNIINFVIIAILTSVLSQMGDLFASLIKRENGVKDFGNIMPGHGGVLDRFDSLLLTAPCIFIFLKIFTLIG